MLRWSPYRDDADKLIKDGGKIRLHRKTETFITPDEFERAEDRVVKLTQRFHYRSEIEILEKMKLGSKVDIPSSSIRSLSPYLDPITGILRVDSRMHNAIATDRQKFPYILPTSGISMSLSRINRT